MSNTLDLSQFIKVVKTPFRKLTSEEIHQAHMAKSSELRNKYVPIIQKAIQDAFTTNNPSLLPDRLNLSIYDSEIHWCYTIPDTEIMIADKYKKEELK